MSANPEASCQNRATTPVAAGLEGVVVAETRLSHVDGEAGRLIIAGADVETLAARAGFEETTAALWKNAELEVPADLRLALGRARTSAFAGMESVLSSLRLESAMDALRASTAQLPDTTVPVDILGAVSVYAAAWARLRAGQAPIAPNPALSHASDYLAMLGAPHDPSRARGMDAYWVTVSDHGLNASTFAARVVTSTGSDTVSAVVAAIGALKGPLHGGAPGPVLDMLDAVERSGGGAREWLKAELAAGRRIMGMGHRIYRVRDPRAAVLEKAIESLERDLTSTSDRTASATQKRLTQARELEREAQRLLAERHPERALRANVEFYTAVLLEALGVPRELFSASFAAGRTAGWLAHIQEQRRTGRLVRPASRYIGVVP